MGDNEKGLFGQQFWNNLIGVAGRDAARARTAEQKDQAAKREAANALSPEQEQAAQELRQILGTDNIDAKQAKKYIDYWAANDKQTYIKVQQLCGVITSNLNLAIPPIKPGIQRSAVLLARNMRTITAKDKLDVQRGKEEQSTLDTITDANAGGASLYNSLKNVYNGIMFIAQRYATEEQLNASPDKQKLNDYVNQWNKLAARVRELPNKNPHEYVLFLEKYKAQPICKGDDINVINAEYAKYQAYSFINMPGAQ